MICKKAAGDEEFVFQNGARVSAALKRVWEAAIS
jgi:hypothetical protein